MDEIKKMIVECLPALRRMSIDELRSFLDEWITELQSGKMPEWVINCCYVIVKTVIDIKILEQ